MTNPCRAMCAELATLAKRKHYYCEDRWYSCAKAEDGCSNDSDGEDCNCGADIHNAKVEAIVAAPVPEPGEVAELVAWLLLIAGSDNSYSHARLTRAAELLQQQVVKIQDLEQQLETERMRVVACGIIATSDTPFSATKNRDCHPDYWSASADDIARQIDELMRLRAQQEIVPVSERLPGPEDCDAEGRCWLGGDQLATGSPTWILGYPAWASRFPDVHYCWLPAQAIPLPHAKEVNS